MKQKAFFIIFEGLSLKQIKKNWEGESPTLSFQSKRNFLTGQTRITLVFLDFFILPII